MKNDKVTSLDFNQYSARMYDSEKDAQRVVLVGGENLTINADISSQSQSSKIEIREIKVPEIIKQIEIKETKVPEIIKEIEIREIKVPEIIREVQIKEIQVPVVTQELKIIEVPTVILKPEYIEKYIPMVEYKEIEKFIKVPNWAKVCIIAQTVALIGLLLVKLIK